MKTTKRQIIKDVPYGVYVWRTPEGGYISDSEGGFLLVFCTEGDQNSIKALAAAAKSLGYDEGEAVFWSGRRPISDDEYQNQLDRRDAGLVPDVLDIGAIMDEERALRQQNK